jgi:hypothetical protein
MNATTPIENVNKGTTHHRQLQVLFNYLKNHTATASMVSEATGIYQKNICRFKRSLQKAGLLWEVKKTSCKVTGFKAHYLTTDPAKAPQDHYKQLTLF